MATKPDIENLFASLDQEPNVDSFSERKKLQKLVYLSEVFGIRLGFEFHWYIHGPYSPDLTRVMFDKEKGNSVKIKDSPDFQNKILKLKNFLGDDIQSSDALELIASTHYISSLYSNPRESKNDIIELLSNEKPQFSIDEIQECYERILPLFN